MLLRSKKRDARHSREEATYIHLLEQLIGAAFDDLRTQYNQAQERTSKLKEYQYGFHVSRNYDAHGKAWMPPQWFRAHVTLEAGLRNTVKGEYAVASPLEEHRGKLVQFEFFGRLRPHRDQSNWRVLYWEESGAEKEHCSMNFLVDERRLGKDIAIPGLWVGLTSWGRAMLFSGPIILSKDSNLSPKELNKRTRQFAANYQASIASPEQIVGDPIRGDEVRVPPVAGRHQWTSNE